MSFTIDQFKQWIVDTFPDNRMRAIEENNFREGLARMADYVFDTNSSTYIGNSVQLAEAAKKGAEAFYLLAKDAQIKAELTSIENRSFQDDWNIPGNVPNIGTLVLTPADKGKYWKVSTGGTTSLTGTPITAAVGAEFIWAGSKWSYIPASDTSYQRVIALESNTLLSSGASDNLFSVSDSLGNVIFSILPNGRDIYPPLPNTKLSNLDNKVRERMLVDWLDSPLAYFIMDKDGYVLSGELASGKSYPPAAYKPFHIINNSKAVKTNWQNRYPLVTAGLRNFASKVLSQTLAANGDNAVKIVMWGDSIFARETHTSVLDIVPSTNPPGLVTKNIASYLWEGLKVAKPEYRRFDVASIFTETGSFSTVINKAAWDDASDRPTDTRLSVTASAAVSWTITAEIVQCNFIDRTATDGTTSVTITATPGQLEVMLPGTDVWTEANGAVFSQRQTTGTRIGNTIYQRRIQFRRKSGVSGVITVTITKDGSADALMYWGIELLKNTKKYVQLINTARGGHTLEQLVGYMENDVIQRKPDLVILEIPLINMIAANSSIDHILNWVQDVVWGDRVGFENVWSLKAKSNNFGDFDVLLVIPQVTRDQMNPDKSFKVQSSGYTAPEIYNAVKSLIAKKGLHYIDMFFAFNEFAKLNYDSYYDAVSTSSITGGSLTTDNIHQNDKGTALWAENLVPILYLNSI